MGCSSSKSKVASEDQPSKSEKKQESSQNQDAKNDQNYETLDKAALKGKLDNVIYLIEHEGVDKYQKDDKDGSTPLHWAAYGNQVPILQYLIEKQKCDVDKETESGNTPLHVASLTGSVEAVQYLLEHGANKEAKNKKGETPYHYALNDQIKALLK